MTTWEDIYKSVNEEYSDVRLEVLGSKVFGSVGYNPLSYPIYKLVITNLLILTTIFLRSRNRLVGRPREIRDFSLQDFQIKSFELWSLAMAICFLCAQLCYFDLWDWYWGAHGSDRN